MSGEGIEHYAAQWESNARADAHFAVLTDPDRLDGRWDAQAFYASGETEIARLLGFLESAGIAAPRDTCLDFGCGAGRLTRALAARFGRTLGIDIAPTMIELARAAVPDAEFAVNQRDDLALVPDAEIAFVHSNIVLQHMNNTLQRRFLAEFCRVLAPGGLAAVQCPSARLAMIGEGVRARLPEGLAALLKRGLRRAPAPAARDDTAPVTMEMHCLPETEVARVVTGAGCVVERIVYTNATENDYGGRLAFFSEREARRRIFWRRARIPSPYLSALYLIRKPLPG